MSDLKKLLDTELPILDEYDDKVINLLSEVFYKGHDYGVKEYAKYLIDRFDSIRCESDFADMAYDFINS